MLAAAARIASVATASNIAKDCAPEYNPRCVECCTPIAICSAPAAATRAENFAESASNAIGGGTNAAATPVAAPADSAAKPASVAADNPTASGTIANVTIYLLEGSKTTEAIVTELGRSHMHELVGPRHRSARYSSST
jgi:hypothetical protein